MDAAEQDRLARTWARYTEPSFVEVDGLRTAYRREGAGPTVVYLHGGGLTRIWLPFLELLAERHDVVAPEHPGFGDTGTPDELARLSDLDDLVLHYDALLDGLDLTDVHLVGHSIGGWIAAELAVFYPRRFASLTLITPSGVRVRDAPLIDTFRMLPEEARAALFNGREQRYAELLDQEDPIEDAVRAYGEAAIRARLAWNPRYDHKLDHRLARVRAPTLVVGVEDDRIVPTGAAARYAELVPGARLATVTGDPGEPTGHAVHVERPADVAGLVTAHVATAEGV